MRPLPTHEAALLQLGSIPGVVGSLIFDRAGEVVASGFPAVFDASGLHGLARRLASDGYFLAWMAGAQAAMDFAFGDGHVVVRTVDDTWLLVLGTQQVDPQLLAMSLTQVMRRLRLAGSAPPTSPWDA